MGGRRAKRLLLWIGLASLLACNIEQYPTQVPHDLFAARRGCAGDQVTATFVTDHFEVRGCGLEARYRVGRACPAGAERCYRPGPFVTPYWEIGRLAYRATDGSLHVGWDSDPPAREAALASAARDLPCPSVSLVADDTVTVEGCGQRITYKPLPEPVPTTPPGQPWIAAGYRYVEVARVPVVAPVPLGSSETPATPTR
jgi:hypothetical protein